MSPPRQVIKANPVVRKITGPMADFCFCPVRTRENELPVLFTTATLAGCDWASSANESNRFELGIQMANPEHACRAVARCEGGKPEFNRRLRR